MQADHVRGMNVLVSYAAYGAWLEKYQQSFQSVLVDSGAFSELSSGAVVDIGKYREWSEEWCDRADGIAGLDDISGDWKRSLRNYEAVPWSFPTFHDTDPPGLMHDLIALSRDRPQSDGKPWLGIGLKPPRQGKGRWMEETLELVPDDVHVHGWAMRAYEFLPRLDSVDSTNWWRDAMKLRTIPDMQHLTYGECLEIVVKRYQRWSRRLRKPSQAGLPFGGGTRDAD